MIRESGKVRIQVGDAHFSALGFQFKINVIGAPPDNSNCWLSRNRPSRETAYCCLPVLLLASRVGNRATGAAAWSVDPVTVIDDAISFPSEAMK